MNPVENAPWPKGRFPKQRELTEAALLQLDRAGIPTHKWGLDSIRTWANYPAENFYRHVAEQVRNLSDRMERMPRTAQWFEMRRIYALYRYLSTMLMAMKMGRSNLVRVPAPLGRLAEEVEDAFLDVTNSALIALEFISPERVARMKS